MKCEVCGETEDLESCSGLDQPELYFCLSHYIEHLRSAHDGKGLDGNMTLKAALDLQCWHRDWDAWVHRGISVMGNEQARFYDKTKSEKFSQMMDAPEQAKRFGGDAWVYSEIKARVMVIEAYERGLSEQHTPEV